MPKKPVQSCHTKALAHGMPGVHLRGVVIDIGIARLLRIQQACSRGQIGGGAAFRLETKNINRIQMSHKGTWMSREVGKRLVHILMGHNPNIPHSQVGYSPFTNH